MTVAAKNPFVVIVIVPLFVPVEEGLNVTFTSQLDPEDSSLEQEFS